MVLPHGLQIGEQISNFHYRHMKVGFLQGGSERQQKETLLMEMFYVL